MLKLLLIFALTLSLSAETIEENQFMNMQFWKQEDKQKHFIGSFEIATVSTGIARHYKKTKLESFLIGVGTSIIIGWAKEVHDGRGGGTKDINDLDADMIGSLAGSAISAQFNWRF